MSKYHKDTYEAVASIIRDETDPGARDRLAAAFTRLFERDSKLFDPDRFNRAAGIKSVKEPERAPGKCNGFCARCEVYDLGACPRFTNIITMLGG